MVLITFNGGNCSKRIEILMPCVPMIGSMVTLNGKVLGNVFSLDYYIKGTDTLVSVQLTYP